MHSPIVTRGWSSLRSGAFGLKIGYGTISVYVAIYPDTEVDLESTHRAPQFFQR